MKIRVSFWSGLGGQSPTLGNVRGFQHFGDVEYIPCENTKAHDINQGADLFFTPNIQLIQSVDPRLFTILQMGGQGSSEMWRMGLFNSLYSVTDHAEVVTMLDTNLLHFLRAKDQPWNWKKVFLVPNGMHYDMFRPPEQKRKGEFFTGFMGKLGGVGKAGYDVAKVAAAVKNKGYSDRIRLVAPIQTQYIASPDWIPIEPLPFYKMPQQYQQADIYLNVPEEEVLPNTIFEAFLTGLPVVVSGGTSIARLQTVPAKYLGKMRADFGTSVDYFDEEWKPHYDEGESEHYLQGEDMEDVAKQIILLYENPDLREKLGAASREWALKLDWSFHDKCKLLMKLAREAGLEVG